MDLNQEILTLGMEDEMIRKKKDGYYVLSENGRNLGGPYKTREAAKKRLKEVEKFKHMKKENKK